MASSLIRDVHTAGSSQQLDHRSSLAQREMIFVREFADLIFPGEVASFLPCFVVTLSSGTSASLAKQRLKRARGINRSHVAGTFPAGVFHGTKCRCQRFMA